MESLPTLLGFGGLVIGLIWGVIWYLRRMARQALNPRFTWTPLDPARGESLDLVVDVAATQGVQVRSIEAHLICTRLSYPPPNANNGNLLLVLAEGNNPLGTPERDVCSHCKVALCHEMLFQPGTPMKLVAQLDIPGDGLPTRVGGRLQIHWALQIRFDIANFPPLVLERTIEVLHEPRGRPANHHAYAPPAPAPVPLFEDHLHNVPMHLPAAAPPKALAELELDGGRSISVAARWPFGRSEATPLPAPIMDHGDTMFSHLELEEPPHS